MFNKCCALCSTTNKKHGKVICDDCSFIKEFIIKYGRENMRLILANAYSSASHTPSPAINNFMPPYYNYSMPQLPADIPSAPSAPVLNMNMMCRVCRNASCSCRQRVN